MQQRKMQQKKVQQRRCNKERCNKERFNKERCNKKDATKTLFQSIYLVSSNCNRCQCKQLICICICRICCIFFPDVFQLQQMSVCGQVFDGAINQGLATDQSTISQIPQCDTPNPLYLFLLCICISQIPQCDTLNPLYLVFFVFVFHKYANVTLPILWYLYLSCFFGIAQFVI